jgi:dolichol-phosphate mannosyltransferase
MTETRRLRLDTVCPVFREESVIGLFHRRLCAVLDGLGPAVETRVVYVVDPGGDATERLLENLAAEDPRIQVIILSRRFGHQASLVAGLDHTDADAVVMMDSDLQHPPELIPRLLDEFRAGADIVQTLRSDPPSTPLPKRVTSRWFYGALRRLSGLPISPGATDFRLLSRRVVDVFRERLCEQNPFLRGLTTWVGYRSVLVPFVAGERAAGYSNYTWGTLVELALRGICAFSKTPIRVAALFGFAMSGLSVLYGVIAVATYFLGSYVPPGWTSALATASLVGGIQLFFLGVIAEYVGFIFDEVKARPRYLVDRSVGATTVPVPEDAPAARGRRR